MIIYSVTVTIEESVHLNWLNWMQARHIPDVMDTGYFTRFEIRKLVEPAPEPGHKTYNIQYHCRSMKDLQRYQGLEAERLQKEHQLQFNGRYAAFRTILESI